MRLNRFLLTALALALASAVLPSSANVIGQATHGSVEPDDLGQLPRDPISYFITHAMVQQSISDGPIQFFPIDAPPEVLLTAYVSTLAEAYGRGEIEIREIHRMDQFSLMLRNDGRSPVFAQGGDFFGGGGYQNRFSQFSFLAPPGETIRVSVFCAEKGRNTGESDVFGWMDALGSPTLRGLAVRGNQQQVWDEIESVQRAFPERQQRGTSYGTVVQDEKVQARLDAMAGAALRGRATGPSRVGMVCAISGRIAGVDVYGSPRLFEAMWPKLLNSYLIEAVRSGFSNDGWVSTDEAAGALASVASARRRPVPSIGLGETYVLDGRGPVAGQALTWEGHLVHASMVSMGPWARRR
ncbi:MAG TPA: hypothetical protein PLD23_09860 [Armatimonadota bacterium]|nr:hypothetical protein [Armatimonadota bacterium]